jgi:pyruvate dehydrogenase E1 component
MYTDQEDVFYYLTLYNENYTMPELPVSDAIQEAILKGGYCFQAPSKKQKHKQETIHLLSSGSIMQQVIKAAARLDDLGYQVKIWSITSFTELERDAQSCERWNRLNPSKDQKIPYVQSLFSGESGVFVAVTDFMKSLPNKIERWIPGPYIALGTDGYGLSESRENLRDFFEINEDYIAQAALSALYKNDQISLKQYEKHVSSFAIEAGKVDPLTRAGVPE